MTLHAMAEEYRANINLLELRVLQLQAAQKQSKQKEATYRLKKRITCLHTMINENRKAVFEMEHYHEKRGLRCAD